MSSQQQIKRNRRMQSVGNNTTLLRQTQKSNNNEDGTPSSNFNKTNFNNTYDPSQLDYTISNKFKVRSPLKHHKMDPTYSFSEGPSFMNEKTVEERARTKLPHFKPSTSLAEENLVKNFNKFQRIESINLPTNQPQRIELPLFFNTPNRTPHNPHLRARSFTNTNNNTNPSNNTFHKNKISTIQQSANDVLQQQKNQSLIQGAEKIRAQRRLKDYNMLGFACRRAGKVRDEGRTYYSQGVLCDNMGKYKEAIVHYKKFLQVCRQIGDSHGEALSYNCIGVNYQLLGEMEDPKHYKDAIIFHKNHEELADINGKFLALINLGLCYDKLQMFDESMVQYQNALRHSIKMANLVGQTIAIGNIGKIGTSGLHANKEKMKVFVEKYLKLSSELRDKGGEINAHIKMGQLDIQSHEYDQGRNHFEKALELAQQNGDQQLFSYSKCGYAISNVENHLQDYLKDYQQNVIHNNHNTSSQQNNNNSSNISNQLISQQY